MLMVLSTPPPPPTPTPTSISQQLHVTIFSLKPDIVPLCHAPAKKNILQNGFIRNTPAPSVLPSPPSIALGFRSFRRVETGPKDPPRLPKLHEFKDTPQGYVSPELGTPALYDELQHVSLKGDFIRIHVLVEALVKERGEEPNIQLYLALILANTSTQHGSPAEVERILDEMENEGLGPNPAVYHAVLKVLAIHPHYVMRKDILEHLRQRWFTVTEDGWHDMIVGMIRDRQLELVLDTVELLQREEEAKIKPWLYDMIVYTLCDIEEFDEALKIMRYRVSSGELLISGTLWFYLLDTASRALHHGATVYAWSTRVETSFLNPPSGVCINVLSTAARWGDFALATDVFRVLGNRSETPRLYHYESLLEACLASSDLKTAFTILCVMVSSGVPPSEPSTRPIYLHLRQNASLPATALSILHKLHESNRPICAPAINVIIEGFVHHQDLAAAIETYKILHELCPSGPTTSTFNTLFRGCAKAARKDLAMFLAAEMVALKVAPNALTYDRLMLVCLTAEAEGAKEEKTGQELADAWHYFEEMRRMSWWPRAGTVVALAKRCCERGDERVWGLVGEGDQEGIGMRQMER
ncbi:hypothetical protein MMC29_007781, partial [Sticta canariensis]|nr:hypothetical protein [Sticta canariensis]